MGAVLVLTAGGTRQPLYDAGSSWDGDQARCGSAAVGSTETGSGGVELRRGRGGGAGRGGEAEGGDGGKGHKKTRLASVYNLLTVPESETAASVGRRHPPLEVWV